MFKLKQLATLTSACFGLLAWTFLSAPLADAQDGIESINFNRDIRPILSDKCFYCHGPDEGHREADLRLDQQESAHELAISPGKPDDSELIFRITSDDQSLLMPPPESGKSLTQKDIEQLKQWISQGGEYAGHWSLQAPVRSNPPQVKQQAWVRNSIDQFVLAKLEKQGIAPSPELDRARLIRRVTLDLTGIPPTPDEVDAFLNDQDPNAYEKVVDRLLTSERYGERMALVWLDAARYADTHGYQVDRNRQMWAWRDWVINAYNSNMPFDQFTVEQVAGDMLPDATLSQKIATGFQRNHRINGEGGAIPEEFRTEYVIDRVSTNGTVWLGMTFECARCHSHKYDPISHEEFYQLFAYFNNVPEKGNDGLRGNAQPTIEVPIPSMQSRVEAASKHIALLESQLAEDTPERKATQLAWETHEREKLAATESVSNWKLPELESYSTDSQIKLQKLADEFLLVSGPKSARTNYSIEIRPGEASVTGIRLEAIRHEQMTRGGLSRSINGNFVLSEIEILRTEPNSETLVSVPIESVIADHSQPNYPVENTIDGKLNTGWAILGKPQVEDRQAVFRFAKPVVCDSSTVLTVRLKHQSQFASHNIGCFRISFTEIASPSLGDDASLPVEIEKILMTPKETRSEAERRQIATHFRTLTPLLKPIRDQIQQAKTELAKLQTQAKTSVMIMEEMANPRPAFLLNRGQYDQPGEEVQPGIPTSLGELPSGVPNNRLGFAQWLVDPANPLTARVAVNRYWQMYFGTGLVKTASDFGSQGEWPSHPKLLDWLAVDFIASGWDVKAMQRQIVTSATYRQTSSCGKDLRESDPENRLLARGPRFRLDGFAIRDQALAASGLLHEKIGGPSVYPYQPAGMWEDLAANAGTKYPQSSGKDLYRRSLYTFWKRAVAPPSLVIFDAATRESCNVNRNATNTPLQSLATLNDVQFVEAARFLAQRMMLEGGNSERDRLQFGWRLLLARAPSEKEIGLLLKAYEFHFARFNENTDEAEALLAIGESRNLDTLDPIELATLTAIANVILNLDETVTKE